MRKPQPTKRKRRKRKSPKKAPSAKPAPAEPSGPPSMPKKAGFTVPKTDSPAPKLAEWNAAPLIDVENAKAANCEIKLVREWLRVSCRGRDSQNHPITGAFYAHKGRGQCLPIYERDGIASLVMQVKQKSVTFARFKWDNAYIRTLEVSWGQKEASATIKLGKKRPE